MVNDVVPRNRLLPQTLLALTFGCGTILCVVTGLVELYPATWSWENAAEIMGVDVFAVWAGAAVVYYPVIFGIQHYLKDAEPFDLGGASTKCAVNWIFWWETALAVFSIIGSYYMLPSALQPFLDGKSWVQAICGRGDALDDPISGYWTFIFAVSKLVEFGDTLFVVLRKKKLIFLQHYHHLATMMYTWACCFFVKASHNSNNIYFCAMNYCVHSVMYTWYAATRTGWRSPKSLMMFVTLIQLAQMLGGLSVVLTSAQNGCPDPMLPSCLAMYFSYFVLFGHLFYSKYLVKTTRKKEL